MLKYMPVYMSVNWEKQRPPLNYEVSCDCENWVISLQSLLFFKTVLTIYNQDMKATHMPFVIMIDENTNDILFAYQRKSRTLAVQARSIL